MTALSRVVVVGASLAGLRAVEFLRRGGFEGEVVLIGDEPHLPYDRPPLSKELLRGEWSPERIALWKKSYEYLGVELALGRRALSVDTDARAVELDDGRKVQFDGMVIATGTEVLDLPNRPHLDGIHTLRTLDDALTIRTALARKPRVAVVGAGFIGAEVAASARQLGLEVTMIEALETPLAQSLGPEIGRMLQAAHEKRGVHVRCGRRVEGFDGTNELRGLRLDDGSRVECELAVIGIGVRPAVAWLSGSGVELDDGVKCDPSLATTVPGVVAAGDVASWYNPLFEERMRVEHWTNAVEQARHAVATLLTRPAKPFESAPMFWSDQFDIKIQGAGHPRPTDELVIVGEPESERFIGLYSRNDTLVGAVAFNRPPKLVRLRTLIAERVGVAEARKIAES